MVKVRFNTSSHNKPRHLQPSAAATLTTFARMRGVLGLSVEGQDDNLKFAFRYSLISIFVLLLIGFVSWWAELNGVLKVSFLCYLAITFVFSVSGFCLVLRRYKIDVCNGIMFKITAIAGAVFCGAIWVVILYPFAWFINAP